MTTIVSKKTQADKPTKARAQSRKKPAPKTGRPKETFAMMPRALTQNPAQFGLGIIEFALLAGLIRGATRRWWEKLDAKAKPAGDRAMVRHQQKHGKNYEAHAKQARSRGFHKRLASLKENLCPPRILRFDLSASAMLTYSGLSDSAANMDKIEAALARLRRPIIADMAAPLVNHRVFLDDGRIRFSVSGDWIDHHLPRVKVPIPLPTKSRTALHLLLFLRAMSDGSSIRLSKLCDWIGMAPCAPFEQARQLDRTLWAVVNCIERNNTTKRTIPAYKPLWNNTPQHYVMKIEDGRVYFGQIGR